MRKAPQPLAAAPVSKVVAFPARPAATRGSVKRERKTRPSNVLKFTGRKVENYDGDALRPVWQEGMLERLGEIYQRTLRGEFTGLMIIGSRGVPDRNSYPECIVNLSGIFSTDVAYAARQAALASNEAEEYAVNYPARPA